MSPPASYRQSKHVLKLVYPTVSRRSRFEQLTGGGFLLQVLAQRPRHWLLVLPYCSHRTKNTSSAPRTYKTYPLLVYLFRSTSTTSRFRPLPEASLKLSVRMSYSQQQQPQHHPLPPPWHAEWDQRDRRYVFINPQTGQRTFEHPHPTYQQRGNYGDYPQQGGYGQQQQQGGYGAGYSQPQVGYQQGGYQTSVPQQTQSSHKALEYGALGAVGGLVTGALAMHEGEKLHKEWGHVEGRGRYNEDEERVERLEDRERVENAYEAGRQDRKFDDYREDAYEDRREDAYEERREDAYEERREDAYEERREDAYEERREDAYEEGREDAYEEGREGRFDNDF